jgi:hypothetical protein
MDGVKFPGHVSRNHGYNNVGKGSSINNKHHRNTHNDKQTYKTDKYAKEKLKQNEDELAKLKLKLEQNSRNISPEADMVQAAGEVYLMNQRFNLGGNNPQE